MKKSKTGLFLLIRFVFWIYMFVLILFVSMKFNGSFVDLWNRAALVRENRRIGRWNANLELFYTIRIYYQLRYKNPIYVYNLMGNIIPFVPMGIFEELFRKYRGYKVPLLGAMAWCLLIILLIEVVQLITGLGYFDVDDIFLNMAGCLTGGIAACLWTMSSNSRNQ